MSVLSHLTSTKNKLVLSGTEKSNIQSSISNLQNRINSYFENQVTEHFIFGSHTRGTILPRKADSRSDIDYMIVFDNEEDYRPQTFIERLRRFAEKYYSSSEIKRSHPTIILELNHIRFDLVPAYLHNSFWNGEYYKIPAPSSDYEDWVRTDPNDFNQSLIDKNKDHANFIKPMVRLVKYWNAQKGHIYESFELEKSMVQNTYPNCYNLKDYFFEAINDLQTYDLPQYKAEKVDRAKQIIDNVMDFEDRGMSSYAEQEIKKLIPELF